jgi:hypothetical protein
MAKGQAKLNDVTWKYISEVAFVKDEKTGKTSARSLDVEMQRVMTDPDTGNVWLMDTDGNWTNTSATDDEIVNENVDDTLVEEEPPEEPPEERKGGLITMMKQGGVPHFDDGGDVSYMPEGAEDNEDGTFTLDNVVYDMMSGNPLYTTDDDGNIIANEITWGDTSGLSIKNDDPKASASFWARQQCDLKKKMDPNTAGFWACYAPSLFGKQLGLSSTEPW